MATSFSTYENAYLNCGPLTFIAGFNNNLLSSDTSNLIQNYPFTDAYQSIMQHELKTSGGLIATNGTSNLPQSSSLANTIQIDGTTDLFTLSHMYTSDVSAGNATKNMVATCDYVQYIESQWSLHPAVTNVDMAAYDLDNVGMVTFDPSSVNTLEASGNVLALKSYGLTLQSEVVNSWTEFDITGCTQSQINFDACGSIVFYASQFNGGNNTFAKYATPAATITNTNNFQTNLVFNDNSTTITAACASGAMTWTTTNGGLPSILTLPTMSVNTTTVPLVQSPSLDMSANEVSAFYFKNSNSNNAYPTTGFVYYAVIQNTEAAGSGNSIVITKNSVGAGNYFAQNVVVIAPGTKVLATIVGTTVSGVTTLNISVAGLNAYA